MYSAVRAEKIPHRISTCVDVIETLCRDVARYVSTSRYRSGNPLASGRCVLKKKKNHINLSGHNNIPLFFAL